MPAEFDVHALYDALDAQRAARNMTWAGVTRALNDRFRDVPARPMSASTVTGMRAKGAVEGNGVLQMLIWLERTPESFVPGHPLANAPEAALPTCGPDMIMRWHTGIIYEALDAQRAARGMTWKQVAGEIGGFNASGLTRLKTPGLVAFPGVMRIFAWLDRPAAAFVRPSRT